MPPERLEDQQDNTELSTKDLELERLAKLDEHLDAPAEQIFDERDKDIVGLQTEKAENWSEGATLGKKLTVAQKVAKELAFVTEAMELDPFQ